MSKDSLISHLLELRSRLLRVILFIFVAIVIGTPFASDLFSFFASPLLASFPENSSMIATQVTSPFMAPFKLLIFSAFLISMPYFFYELWSFIAPGLFENEKSFVGPLIFSTVILFTMGVAFAYFVVCPIIFKFFIGIAPESVIVMTDITQYIGFVMKLVFAFGIAFEMPIATFLLVSSGVVKKSTLATSRPYLILLFFIIGMPSLYPLDLPPPSPYVTSTTF